MRDPHPPTSATPGFKAISTSHKVAKQSIRKENKHP
jgi:hypothetical protein